MSGNLTEILVSGAAAVGVAISPADAAKLMTLAEELIRWNRKVNLTAITAPKEVVLKHLVDSASVIPFLPERGRVVDLGSGGGFPALVVGILRPAVEIVSVDSVEKKIIFQRHAARLLGLANVTPEHLRAETLAATRQGYFDAAVSRAFAAIETFVRFAAPVVKGGGLVVAMKGPEGRDEAEGAAEVLVREGVTVAEIAEFPLPGSGDRRSIVVLRRSCIKHN